MDTKTKTYFMIADAHIAGGEVEQEFFRMLERLSALPPSVAVVFLGDIFELWIALRRYEADLHRRFIRWCETEKQKRQIIFTEGNHEFFLPRRLFTRSGRGDIRINDLLFTHGDRINPKDIPYLFFRMGVRNFFTKGEAVCGAGLYQCRTGRPVQILRHPESRAADESAAKGHPRQTSDRADKTVLESGSHGEWTESQDRGGKPPGRPTVTLTCEHLPE